MFAASTGMEVEEHLKQQVVVFDTATSVFQSRIYPELLDNMVGHDSDGQRSGWPLDGQLVLH